MDINFHRRIIGGLNAFKVRRGDQFEVIATLILRVPGYFILNFWWEFDVTNSVPRSLAWSDVVSSGFAIFVMVQGLLLLLLPLRQVVLMYMHYLSVAVLAASDHFSRYYVNSETELEEVWPGYGAVSFQGFSNIVVPHKPLFDMTNMTQSSFLRHQLAAIVFHTIAACVVSFFLDLNNSREKILLLVYWAPIFARLSGLPVQYLSVVHNFASCFVLFLTVMYIFLCLPHVFKFLKDTYMSLMLMLELYGAFGLTANIFGRIFVPLQLFLFWLMLFVTQLYKNLLPVKWNDGNVDTNAEDAPFFYTLMLSAAETCHTPLMLSGTCAAVAYASRSVLTLAHWFIVGDPGLPGPQNMPQNGMTEGATMFLLSIQTSLYTIEIPERVALLTVILLIVVSSLIQSMYELVEPHVLTLSAQGSMQLSRHIRAIAMCLLLLFLPLYMVYVFTVIFEQDFWLLLVVSTSLMSAVQVFGLLTTYGLLTYDAYCAKPWLGLDDVIYYTRATTRVFEFLVAVFVVGAGLKEAFSGQWTVMNVTVLVVHCYFNIFQRLQQGWKSFLSRIKAAKKISGLPDATQKQLDENNDVCSICFAEMTVACVTSCKHLFHSPCLKKWLYVQDTCPLCQTRIQIPNEQVQKSYDQPQENESPVVEDPTVGTSAAGGSGSSSTASPTSDATAESSAEKTSTAESSAEKTSTAASSALHATAESSAEKTSTAASSALDATAASIAEKTSTAASSALDATAASSALDATAVCSDSSQDDFSAPNSRKENTLTATADTIEEEVGSNIPLIVDSDEEDRLD